MNPSRFLNFAWKELLETARGRMVAFILYAFTLNVIIAATGLHLSLDNAGMTVLDHDRSPTSRELIGRFTPPYFNRHPSPRDENAMIERLDADQDLIGLVIPPDFEAALMRGDKGAVQLFLDGSRAAHSALADAYVQQIVSGLSLEVAIKRLGLPADARDALPVVEPALRVRFNPNREETFYQGMNEMVMMLAMLALALPAAALVRERERGTIEQLLVSPMTPSEIMLAKTTASTLVLLMGETITVFGVLIPIFHLPVRGSLGLFFACSAIFVFTMSGLGLTVASLCRTMAQVGMFTFLVLAPLMLLSGTWTPPEAMPTWLAAATALSPLRWFNDITYGVFLRGATVRDLLLPVAAMSGLGALFFASGALRFRARFR